MQAILTAPHPPAGPRATPVRQRPLLRTVGPMTLLTLLGALLFAFAGQIAHANPEGVQVSHGTADFHQPDANTLNVTTGVTTGSGTILNWQQFNVQPNETTRFIQPGATSAVLNRVVGQTPSADRKSVV